MAGLDLLTSDLLPESPVVLHIGQVNPLLIVDIDAYLPDDFVSSKVILCEENLFDLIAG